MEFHFLWVIGLGLLLGWLLVDQTMMPRNYVRARSWYAVPVIGAVMVVTFVCIQLAQVLS